jgi:hypothetical protein
MGQKKWQVVLNDGCFRLDGNSYTGGEMIKLSGLQFQQFKSFGLIKWSDHPAFQLKLALAKWQSQRDDYLAEGGTEKQFRRKQKKPSAKNLDGDVLLFDQQGES